MITWHEVLLRLLIALLLCTAVGAERYLAGKAAGIRTHVLVGVGAAMFTIISGYAFHATAANADRIAAQIVTGIGFIGGGAILKERGSIRGLTTAAGLWAAAAIGMAAGSAMYAVAGFGTLIILVTLQLLGRGEQVVPRRARQTWLVEVMLAPEVTPEKMEALMQPLCRCIVMEELHWEGENRRVVYQVEFPTRLNLDDLTMKMREIGAPSVRWTLYGNSELEPVL